MVLPLPPPGADGLERGRAGAADHPRGAHRRRRGAPCLPAPADAMPARRAQHRRPPRRPPGQRGAAARPALRVRDGCCCGRTEDGFAPVPTELYHDEWERRRLRNVVHLTIGGCLGPCALANVVLLLLDGQALWFHSMDSDALVLALYDHIEAMLDAGRPCRCRPTRPRCSSRPPPGSRGPMASPSTITGRAGARGRATPAQAALARAAGDRWPRPRRTRLHGSSPTWATRRGAAPERRAGLRRALAGARLRHGSGAVRAGVFAWEEFRQALIARWRPPRREGRLPLLRRLARRVRGRARGPGWS